MTLTPFTDAARQSVALTREAYAKRNTQDPVQLICERMSQDICAAALIGTAELLDRECASGDVALAITDGLASGLASVTISMASGNETMALRLVGHFIEQIKRLADVHVREAPERGIVGTAVSQSIEGNA